MSAGESNPGGEATSRYSASPLVSTLAHFGTSLGVGAIATFSAVNLYSLVTEIMAKPGSELDMTDRTIFLSMALLVNGSATISSAVYAVVESMRGAKSLKRYSAERSKSDSLDTLPSMEAYVPISQVARSADD